MATNPERSYCSTVALYTAEALACHKVFDKIGLPRKAGRELLSLSQRAEYLRGADIRLRPVSPAGPDPRVWPEFY